MNKNMNTIVSAHLCAETVQSSALSLESVDDVEGSDGLPLCVLGVGDGVTDDVLKDWRSVGVRCSAMQKRW
jgi:hypothetical protein